MGAHQNFNLYWIKIADSREKMLKKDP